MSVAFLALAGWCALALPHPHPRDALAAAWFVAVVVLLLKIEFDVGEGRTRPVQLALVPMLLVLPPGDVPLLMAGAHLVARLPDIVRGRTRPHQAVLVVADCWFSLPPAVLLALIGHQDGLAGYLAVGAAALGSQVATDFAVSALRLRVGLGVDPRTHLALFAWVYLVDVLLTPVGALAALAAHHTPLAVAAVLPLAALLAVFARERKGRIENALELHRVVRESEERLRSIVQHSSDLIAVLDAAGTIRSLSGSVGAVFGPDASAAVGTRLPDHAHPEDAARLSALLAAAATTKAAGESLEAEVRLRHADGHHRHVELVATNLLEEVSVGGLVVTARDVESRKAFEEQLRHRAFHDPLTQLANRALFYDRLEHALASTGQEHIVAVIFVDLDDFKRINDSFGHGVGDELLVGVAGRLQACLAPTDTAARLGGDEFGILLETAAGANEAVRLAERILLAFEEPFALAGESRLVRVSLGLALSPSGGVAEELLQRADVAMYAAKRNGKGRWELHHPGLEDGTAASSSLEGATWFMRGAEQKEEILSVLARPDGLLPVYQPILDLRSGTVAGYEALSRINSAVQRPPNAWFAQAHRCGLGYELEARAIEVALAGPQRPAGTYLALNVSPSALASAPVQAVLPERLDGLVIEITEHELLTDDPAIAAAIAAVRARGARLAVDDAGSGYAGLKQVMRLAPDLIKLDRSLVEGVHLDPVKAALVESFVGYAREMRATVCAEGIEHLEELVRLADLDVTYGQGYVIARPAPPWAAADEGARNVCTASFSAMLAEVAGPEGREGAEEGQLESLVSALSAATTRAHVIATLPAVARSLRADAVRVLALPADLDARVLRVLADDAPDAVLAPATLASLRERRVLQVTAGDAGADPDVLATLTEQGMGCVLMMPVARAGETVGVLEAYSVSERPWSRFEVGRARILGHQLAAVLDRVGAPAPAGPVPGRA